MVDVAVPPRAQPGIARQVLVARRHMLGQKPFALSSATALELADLAEENDVFLAVNQQMRFDEGPAAAHHIMELGWLGEITSLEIKVDIWSEWADWPWMLELDELEVWYHSVHYHDLVRWFLGEPDSVYCVAGRTPGQAPRAETRTMTIYSFAGGARALVTSNHENSWGDASATFRVQGNHGAVRGTLGMLYDYPTGRPDTLEVTSDLVPTDGWVPYPVTTRWLPDAFLGPMASLLAAACGARRRSHPCATTQRRSPWSRRSTVPSEAGVPRLRPRTDSGLGRPEARLKPRRKAIGPAVAYTSRPYWSKRTLSRSAPATISSMKRPSSSAGPRLGPTAVQPVGLRFAERELLFGMALAQGSSTARAALRVRR